MSAAAAVIDLDDVEGLLGADREGMLRAASMAGAHVRAKAAAVAEGALAPVSDGQRPRSVIWVAARGPAAAAGAVLASLLAGVAAEPIVLASNAPPWIGPLDVLVIAGDDAGDPALTAAASLAVRRGARVVVVAPYEGPLRDVTAGRAAVLEPRLPTQEVFGLSRYLAAGLAALAAVDPALRVDIDAIADELDAEALRSSATREVFTNPAKAVAQRMAGRRVALAADSAATLALARHAGGVLLRVAGEAAAAASLSDVLVALHEQARVGGSEADLAAALFHDDELDGPLPERLRAMVLTLDDERALVAARVAGHPDVDVISADDVPDATPAQPRGAEQQLAVLTVRLEMAAVYLRLVRG